MAWFLLILAGKFKTGWPSGLNIAQQESARITECNSALIFIGVNRIQLWLAQREIPVGIVYAIRTGIILIIAGVATRRPSINRI